eukprot:8111-Heterococcus_DN1.PRE.2
MVHALEHVITTTIATAFAMLTILTTTALCAPLTPPPQQVRAASSRLCHSAVPHGLLRPRRAVRASDAAGTVPQAADAHGRRVWSSSCHQQPGSGQP